MQVVMNSGCAIPFHVHETLQKYAKIEDLNYYMNIYDSSPQNVLSVVPSGNILSNAMESADVNEVLAAEEFTELHLSAECVVAEQVPPYESGERINFVGHNLNDAMDLRGWKDSEATGTGEVSLKLSFCFGTQEVCAEVVVDFSFLVVDFSFHVQHKGFEKKYKGT